MNWRRESKYNVVSEEGYRVCFVRVGPMLDTPERRFYEAWTPPMDRGDRSFIARFGTPDKAKAACELHAQANRTDM